MNAHARPLTDAWWNAPIFYPMRGALALSESLLGITPPTTPMQCSAGIVYTPARFPLIVLLAARIEVVVATDPAAEEGSN